MDIAVIGGGYSGLSSAWHLAKANPTLNIVIFEAKQVGSGASGRNGGMVLPGSEEMDFYEDGEASKRHYDLTVTSMKKLEALVKSTGVDADLVLGGYLEAILDEEDIAEYQDYVETANDLGIPLEYWNADETEEELGTDRYVGAVYDPNGGQVHAMKLVNALRKAVELAGVMGEHRNIYYALGYNGHGINLAFLFGDVVATLYQGKAHPWFDHADEVCLCGYLQSLPNRSALNRR